MSKKLLSDYPRGVPNGFVCWWFSTLDALPVTPALPVTFLFARRLGPVALLGLPPRPGARRFPALLTAVALPRPSRPKALLAALEQTQSRPRSSTLPARRTLPPAALLIFGMACSTLGRAHGRSLLPEAPAPEGIAFPSGAQQIFGSIRDHNSIAKIRCPAGLASQAFSFSPPAAARL